MRTAHEQPEDIEDDEVIGKALSRSLVVLALLAVVAGGVVLVRTLFSPAPPQEQLTKINLPQERQQVAAELPRIPLVDVTQASGVDWVHVNGMEGEKLLPETMGGGVGVFDYDRDGDLDLLFVGGTTWDWSRAPIANPRSLCLYANDGGWKFRDVTQEAGLQVNFFGMGPAIADADNDGWPDLFVTVVGKNRFFRNVNGRFVDQTEEAGLGGKQDGWSSGATWLDYNKDGLLDLFVCDYVLWNRDLDLSLGFKLVGVGRAYGQPTLFTGTHSALFRNEGDCRFTDVTKEVGIEVYNENTNVPVGKGLAAMAVDVDHDGWQDVMVANDTVQNFLFMNQGGTAFQEMGVPLGVAFDRSGNATGAMGVDCAYLRNDDALAIAVGNFANEPSSLFMTRGGMPPFTDQAMVTGLGPMSRLNLTFGMCFADLDLDSRQDLFCANGHLEEEIAKVQTTQQYEQPPQFFWNAGSGGTSELVPLGEPQVASDALRPMVGRGAAFGDLDLDGDLDIVLVANGGPPRLLRNDQATQHHWLRIRLQGAEGSNRDAIGAVVSVRAAGQNQRRTVVSTRSYLSQCEIDLTFGLGHSSSLDEVRVDWPSGRVELFELAIDQSHQLVEGSGKPPVE